MKRVNVKIEDKQIAKEYVENGGNGTQAVHKIKPDLTYGTARVKAHRLLTSESFQKTLKELTPEYIQKRHITSTVGYVYLIKSGGLYKIGYTNHIANRITCFKTSLPTEVFVVQSTLVPNSKKTEKLLHEQYKLKRTHGEWFQLDDNDLSCICLWLNNEQTKTNQKTDS